MRIDFQKLDGLGNDFVMVDNMDGSLELTPEQVIAICDRHFGVGADGVILVQPSPREECAGFMNYINSDGTLAQMCGNGVRCFAKFLVDNGIISPDGGHLVADTLAGPKPIEFQTEDGKLTRASVDMGSPILDPALVPIAAEANAQTPDGTPCVMNLPIPSPWGDFEFTAVSMGNPHAVCFIDDWDALPDAVFKDPKAKSLESLDIDLVGAFYESNPLFPEKANIEFAEVHGDGSNTMRVFERGCGETLACGTGACATRVAAAITERAPRRGPVTLPGGTLDIDWNADGTVIMTGPAEHTFSGTLEL